MAASYTPNINLAKPDRQDYVSVVTDINNNMELIDAAYGNMRDDFGDVYDPTATYAKDDICIYNNVLYQANTAISTPEAWNASHWDAKSVADLVGTLNSKITTTAGTLYTHSHTSHTVDNVATLFKTNGIVTIQADIEAETGYTFTTSSNILQVSSGFEPSSNIKIPAMLHHSSLDVWVAYFVTILTNGYIQQNWTSSCDKIWISASYRI